MKLNGILQFLTNLQVVILQLNSNGRILLEVLDSVLSFGFLLFDCLIDCSWYDRID